MKRRFLAVFAAVAIVFSLAACNNTGNNSSSSGNLASSGNTAQPTTIRWFWREGGDIVLPENSYIVRKIQDLINVRYVHITPIGQTVEEKLTTMLSTDDVPDIAESWSEYTTKLRDFGAILPVDDIVAGDALNNVKNNQLLFDEAWALMKRSDGKTWAIPATFASLDGPTPYIRYDWLSKLGLEVPKTFEELATVLDQFANRDPDGNGRKDTWGTSYGGVYSGFSENFGASATTWYRTDDGSLEWGLFTDRIVPYMRYMRGLMQTNGLNNEIVDPDELGSKHSNYIKAGKIGFSFGYNSVNDNAEIQKVQPEADWRPMAPPKGVYDVGYLPMGGIMRQEYVVFRDCEREGRLDAALKLMNLLADDGGDPNTVNWEAPYWEVNYGEKGVNWDVIDGVFQNNSNNEKIKANNEGKDYLNGRSRRWRTVSSQLGIDTGLSEEARAAKQEIATYPLISSVPKEPGYPLFVEGAESVSGYQELVQSFNAVWSSYWTQAWLGQVDIERGLEDCRQQAITLGYEDIRDSVVELYRKLGFLQA